MHSKVQSLAFLNIVIVWCGTLLTSLSLYNSTPPNNCYWILCSKIENMFFWIIIMSFLLFFYRPITGACLLVRGWGSIWQATLPKWPVWQRICISTWRPWHPGTWNIVIEAAWLGTKIHTWHGLGNSGHSHLVLMYDVPVWFSACPIVFMYIREVTQVPDVHVVAAHNGRRWCIWTIIQV